MTNSTYTSDMIAARLHALINSKPRSPTLAEITDLVEAVQYEQAEAQSWPVDKLGAEIRETVADWQKAMLLSTNPEDGIVSGLETHVDELADQLPARAQTVSQIISRLSDCCAGW